MDDNSWAQSDTEEFLEQLRVSDEWNCIDVHALLCETSCMQPSVAIKVTAEPPHHSPQHSPAMPSPIPSDEEADPALHTTDEPLSSLASPGYDDFLEDIHHPPATTTAHIQAPPTTAAGPSHVDAPLTTTTEAPPTTNTGHTRSMMPAGPTHVDAPLTTTTQAPPTTNTDRTHSMMPSGGLGLAVVLTDEEGGGLVSDFDSDSDDISGLLSEGAGYVPSHQLRRDRGRAGVSPFVTSPNKVEKRSTQQQQQQPVAVTTIER